jgi:cation/acetate symporter
MSAASFLGISGMIAFLSTTALCTPVGWLVAYLTVLIIVAEPLRNAGKYTMADLLAYRLKQRPVRAMASLSTITVSTFYMIAQMVGAGALVKLLLPGVTFNAAVIGVGVLMIIYVVFGGMLATTWVQIIKAILLMAGSILLSILVLGHFGFSFAKFFEAISHVTYHVKVSEVTENFIEPCLKFRAAVTNR